MRKIGVISIFIFLTGLFAGLFFCTDLTPENSAYLSELLISGMSAGRSSFSGTLSASLLSNFFLAILMTPALLTKYLCPLPMLLLCGKSFSLGFCSGLLHVSTVNNALLFSLLKIIPQNVFLIPAFILLSSAVFYGSASELLKKNRPSHEKKRLKNVMLLSVMLMLAGCLIEAACRSIAL